MMHKSISRILRIGIVLLLTTIMTVFSVFAQEDELTETFDVPNLLGWEFSPTAVVADGLLQIQPGGYAAYWGEWGNINMQLLSRWVGDGYLVISYRVSEMGGYDLQISGNEVSLLKDGETLAHANIEQIPPEEWIHVEIRLLGESHEIILNGQPVLSVVDPEPIPMGGIGFSYKGVGMGEFDDLYIAFSEVVSAPQVPTQEPTAVPTTGETDQKPTDAPAVSGEGVPAYQSETWVQLGGPPGGLGYDIRMVPENPDIMYVTDSGAGIFKSTTSGQSWTPINQGIDSFPDIGTRVFCATIDPHDSNTIWLGIQFSAHIYRSTDGGQTWEERNNGIIPTNSGEHSVRGITIDPNDPNVVYAALEDTPTIDGINRSNGEVYKSTDAGLNWTRIWQGENLTRYIWIDPRNTQRIFVSTGIFDRTAANAGPRPEDKLGGVGILRSEDGGNTWTVLNEENGFDGGLYIPSLFMHPENPDILIAAVSGADGHGWRPGIYMTEDGGDTWRLIQLAVDVVGAEPSMEAVEISTSNPNIWYGASSEVIHRSEDGGLTWVHFPMRTPDRGSGFPIDIQVDPRDPYRLFVNSYAGGNIMSADGGETWVDASQGYTGAGIWGVFVAPGNDWIVTVSANTANFRSTDGGQTWYGVELGRMENNRIMNFRGRVVSFPKGEVTHIIASGDVNVGNVYHSADGGNTWEVTQVVDFEEMFKTGKLEYSLYVARALAHAPSNPDIVYIGYGERYCLLGSYIECHKIPPGLFRSRDGGYTWEHVENTPFSEVSIFTLAVSPDDPNKVFVATMIGAFRSFDGGDTWQRMSNLETVSPGNPGIGVPPIFVFTTDLFNANVVYAGSPRGGVFRSEDGGDSWETGYGMDPNEAINDILLDPNRPGVIYASTRDSGVYYTTDWGETWLLLNTGLISRWVDQMALSDDGSVLYAGTHINGMIRLGTPSGDPPTEPSPPQAASEVKPAEPEAVVDASEISREEEITVEQPGEEEPDKVTSEMPYVEVESEADNSRLLILGIVIGVGVTALILGVVVFFVIRRRG